MTGIEDVRVIGVYAHIDAGKTTTSEAILYFTGRIHRAGSVDDGDTQLDWMEQERRRGITITAAATSCFWRGSRITLIDTPGHIDFTAEVVRSIRVIDGAVIVMCGVGGVETQTETVWRHADRQCLPRLLFVNKLDREGADFDRAIEDAQKRLTSRILPVQLPIGSEARFCGVVDLLEHKAWSWNLGSLPGEDEPFDMAIPRAMLDRVADKRREMVDRICETSESLLEQRLEGREPGNGALRAALRRATIDGELVPVLCGSAKWRIGIHQLLDAVVHYLPAPADMPPVRGTLPGSEVLITRGNNAEDPLCATVFKIVSDPHVGQLAWARVYSGRLEVGEVVDNPRTGEKERIGRIYRIHANRREHIGQMQAGDVVALVGLKSAVTGDTLCHPQAPIQLENFRFPEPVISIALSPISEDEVDRLHICVTHLCEEDPTLLLSYDPETREHILSGMGELHLEIAVDRLRSEYGILAQSSPFQIAYRETIRRKAEATGVYRKQSGGHGHFAAARIRIEPLERGQGVCFKNLASALEVPEGFARAVENGAREALMKGACAGYPVTDILITLIGGKYHEVDSNSLDFRIAGSMGVKQALQQAAPVLLEPVMRVGITVDEEQLGAVLADFGRRRGTVGALHIRGKERNITGEAPLANMRGYATDIRGMTHGRGLFTLEFVRYDQVPERVAEGIVENRKSGI